LVNKKISGFQNWSVAKQRGQLRFASGDLLLKFIGQVVLWSVNHKANLYKKK
jgi:hypothetical protein